MTYVNDKNDYKIYEMIYSKLLYDVYINFLINAVSSHLDFQYIIFQQVMLIKHHFISLHLSSLNQIA